MNIFLNNVPVALPNDYMTLEDLIKWKNISPQGTAVAIDDKIITQNNWKTTRLEPMMHITIISAAFGG